MRCLIFHYKQKSNKRKYIIILSIPKITTNIKKIYKKYKKYRKYKLFFVGAIYKIAGVNEYKPRNTEIEENI